MLQLADTDIRFIRKHFNVVLERTVRELRGEPCLGLEEFALEGFPTNAELSYEVLKTIDGEENGMPGKGLSLVKVALKTGRHHQIRVQMAYHGTPLYGDMKYGMAAEKRTSAGNFCGQRESIALCASSLTFFHPVTKKEMTFAMEPAGGVFQLFR